MRIVICANGVMADPGVAAAWARSADIVIAADGGSRHALAAGVTPSVLVGDLDSLSRDVRLRLEAEHVAFLSAPVDKDETDLELALLWAARQPEVDEIVVLGALGGRPDQALANLMLLAHPALQTRTTPSGGPIPPEGHRCRIKIIDGRWTIEVIRGEDTLEIHGHIGDRVSLIPLGGDTNGVTTEGLVFPLHYETLSFGPARGVSNRLARAVASVDVHSGLLWCFHERQVMPVQSDGTGIGGEEG
jgi:thiamine pyrophosphokinase